MTIINIAAVVALSLVVLSFVARACAGSGANQREEASDALDCCPQCGNYLPCNCNHYEDSSHHHHHRDPWAYGEFNQSSEDESCFAYGHHHHVGSDDWN